LQSLVQKCLKPTKWRTRPKRWLPQ
jgi:hypothetical protein